MIHQINIIMLKENYALFVCLCTEQDKWNLLNYSISKTRAAKDIGGNEATNSFNDS